MILYQSTTASNKPTSPKPQKRASNPRRRSSGKPDLINRNLPVDSIGRHLYHNNNLAVFLHNTFDRLIGPGIVSECLENYGIGTTADGRTVYWNFDLWGNARSAVVAHVNPDTGRVEASRPPRLLHKMNGSQCEPDFYFCPAFFGSQVLGPADLFAKIKTQLAHEDGYDTTFNPTVWVFESVRAALVMHLYLQWARAETVFFPIAATDICSFDPTVEALNNPFDRHSLLKGRRVVLFPNNGHYHQWLEKSHRIKQMCEYIKVSTIMEPDLHRITTHYPINPGDGVDSLLLNYITDGNISLFDDVNIY